MYDWQRDRLGKLTERSVKIFFEMTNVFCILIAVVLSKLCGFGKIHWAVEPAKMSIILYKLQLNKSDLAEKYLEVRASGCIRGHTLRRRRYTPPPPQLSLSPPAYEVELLWCVHLVVVRLFNTVMPAVKFQYQGTNTRDLSGLSEMVNGQSLATSSFSLYSFTLHSAHCPVPTPPPIVLTPSRLPFSFEQLGTPLG